jgi:hypothetical protein
MKDRIGKTIRQTHHVGVKHKDPVVGVGIGDGYTIHTQPNPVRLGI